MTRPPDRFGLQRSSITTARGRYRRWSDPRRVAEASIASARERIRHGTSRGRQDERGAEWVAQMGDPLERETRCWVSAPDGVRTQEWTDGRPHPDVVTIASESGYHGWIRYPAGPHHFVNAWSGDPSAGNPRRVDPAGDWMANSLLYPGWRYLGLTEIGRQPVVSELSRPSSEIELVPTLPWSDPRTLGSADLPHDVEDAVPLIVVEDDETGAVVEWRSLFEGEVFERHWWSELELGVDLDPALFDASVTPDLAPWEGPFRSTVEIPPPSEPPIVTIEDAAHPSVRQTGLLVGRGTKEDHADESSPYPDGVGPFGRTVVIRMDTRSMPVSAQVFLFDAERRYCPTRLSILGEYVGSDDPVAGRFMRDEDAMIVGQFTLPPWLGRLHFRLHVSWHGAVSPGLLPGRPTGAEYAFTLET